MMFGPGCDRAFNKGSHDSLRNKSNIVRSVGSCSLPTEVEDVADVLGVRCRLRRVRSLPAQALNSALRRTARSVAALATLCVLGSSLPTQAEQFYDITLRSGYQVKNRIEKAYDNRDFKAGIDYFAERDLKIDYQGVVELKFSTDQSAGPYDLVLVPLSRPNESPTTKHLVLLAETPKSSRVLLGTISTESKTSEVKDEQLCRWRKSPTRTG